MTVPFDYDFHHDPLPVSWEVYRDANGGRVIIDTCRQADGSTLYAVRNWSRACLSKKGDWDYEASPSNRPDNWLETHRFPTLKEAWKKACVAAQNIVADYKEQVDALRAAQEGTKNVMANYERVIAILSDGGDASMKVFGGSMTPIIESRSVATYRKTDDYQIGDVVLVKMGRNYLTHKITKIASDGRFLISNNKGRDNGWVRKVFGRVIAINDAPFGRPTTSPANKS